MARPSSGWNTSPTSNTEDTDMQGTVLYGAHDIRFEERPEPAIKTLLRPAETKSN